MSPWNHPIDIVYRTESLQGWPRIILEFWNIDTFGCMIPAGYGFSHLPSSVGMHNLEVHCWKPVGNFEQVFIMILSICFFLNLVTKKYVCRKWQLSS